MRIRSRLLLLVCAVLVPALAAAALALAYIYHEEQAFNRASISETASALALALERDIARRQAVLEALGDAESLRRRDLAEFLRYVTQIERRTDVRIVLSDLRGRHVVNSRLALGGPMPRMLPQERAFRARYGNEAILISALYLAPPDWRVWKFAIQVPVRRDGQVVSFLMMSTKASELQTLLADQRLPHGWLATILDQDGVVAARSLDPEKFVGQRVGAGLRAKIAAQPQGVMEGPTLAGVPSTVFYSRASSSGWVFLISVPHAELYRGATRATAALAVVSLLLLGLGLAAALGAARRIARPVDALRDAARRLGRNEPVQASRSGTAELDDVGEAMADASQRLRRATAELEGQVAEAVAHAQKFETLGRISQGIARGFGNVMQALAATVHALKHGAPERRDLLERCERAVAFGADLSHRFAAFDHDGEAVQTIDTSVRLREAKDLLHDALPANVRLDGDFPGTLWPVSVDSAQLGLALLNLVIGARDALPEGGRIVLGARNESVSRSGAVSPGEYVAITVSYNGPAPQEPPPQPSAFARRSGGALVIERARGAAATATLVLPRAAERSAVEIPASAAECKSGAGKGRVLLVEDDPAVRDTVAAGLRASGFEVDPVGTADDALVRIRNGQRYDAVLTETVTPGASSGAQLVEHIRARCAGTGVVVVAESPRPGVPGVRVLNKPYDLQQAVDALNVSIADSSGRSLADTTS